jgi:putative MATE family efflux protein
MAKDMTQGSSTKILITFTVPMILGNIFQQLYNTTDAIIVGKYIGKNALAAVGVATPMISIATFFIYGLCIGTSILMSQLFGSKKYYDLKQEVSTALIAGTLLSAVISIVCIFLSKYFLILFDTPSDILKDAEVYLKIVFGGLIFSFLYNFYSGALRAIGNSKTPLIFLIISCILNGILDIIFIVILEFGVAASAVSTVLAQGIAAILCMAYVYIKIPTIKIKPKELVLNKSLLGQTIKYSWVAALQQTSLFLGRLLIQGIVNPFGTSAIASYNSVTRVDSFMLAPADSFAAAMSTYSAQNKGAGKNHRIIEGYKNANKIIAIYSIVTTLIVFFSAENIIRLFISGSETEVITIGVDYLHKMSIFYILAGFGNILQGLFRGVGKLKIPLISTTLSISVRVLLSYILAPYFGISSVSYGIAAGWIFLVVYGSLMRSKYFKEITSSKYQVNHF